MSGSVVLKMVLFDHSEHFGIAGQFISVVRPGMFHNVALCFYLGYGLDYTSWEPLV